VSDLSPSCQALIDAARGARPSPAHRARIRADLGARLAVTAAAAAATTLTTGTAAGASSSAGTAGVVAAAKVGTMGLFGKILLVCAVVSAAGAGGYAALEIERRGAPAAARHLPRVEIAAVASRVTERADSLAAGPSADPLGAPSTDPAPAPSPGLGQRRRDLPRSPRAAATAKASDPVSIAAEVALLRTAQTALADGDSARSLGALDALAAQHPDGALREERDAARVLALCSAGRVDEARVLGRQFLAQRPRSVQAARVRGSCAFHASPTPSPTAK
jgi:hypothetical protein